MALAWVVYGGKGGESASPGWVGGVVYGIAAEQTPETVSSCPSPTLTLHPKQETVWSCPEKVWYFVVM
jgi:hypothetical protein